MNAIGEHQDRHGNDHHGHGHSEHVHHAHAHQGHDATGSGPTGSLWRQAVSATLHCLLGCAIGEVLGMVIGTALGLHNLGTVVLSIALAFVFGYSLAMRPILKAGLTLAAALPVALASDTVSIATMELVDNALMLVIPGAMDAGLSSALFWGSLVVSLAIAFTLTVPVNRWLLARGRGHAVVHQYHQH
ncbi:MAG TPA: DUF4396 domain-containing protein [Pedococcus sp.]|nr:DUF4396 domain-containing protein [Pedococcus sp.]